MATMDKQINDDDKKMKKCLKDILKTEKKEIDSHIIYNSYTLRV